MYRMSVSIIRRQAGFRFKTDGKGRRKRFYYFKLRIWNPTSSKEPLKFGALFCRIWDLVRFGAKIYLKTHFSERFMISKKFITILIVLLSFGSLVSCGKKDGKKPTVTLKGAAK